MMDRRSFLHSFWKIGGISALLGAGIPYKEAIAATNFFNRIQRTSGGGVTPPTYDAGGNGYIGNDSTLGWSHTCSGSNRLIVVTMGGNSIAEGDVTCVVQEDFSDSTCDTTDTSQTVTMDDTGSVSAGMSISGSGIPDCTTVSTVDSGTQITISNAATATASNVTLTFGYPFTNWWDIASSIYISSGWYLVAPVTGAKTIRVTIQNGPDTIYGVSTSYNGVHQSVPVGTAVENSGYSTTPTVDVSSASGELVVDGAFSQETDLAEGSGQTQRAEESQTDYLGASTEAGASTVTMSWSSAGSGWWATGAGAIKPVE